MKFLKEGRKRGFDPSLKELSIIILVPCHVSKTSLKVGWNFWDFLFPPPKP